MAQNWHSEKVAVNRINGLIAQGNTHQARQVLVRISANVTDDFGERDRFERSVLSCVEWIVGSGRLKVVERLRG